MKVKDIKTIRSKPVILQSTDDYIGLKDIEKYKEYDCVIDNWNNVIVLDKQK